MTADNDLFRVRIFKDGYVTRSGLRRLRLRDKEKSFTFQEGLSLCNVTPVDLSNLPKEDLHEYLLMPPHTRISHLVKMEEWERKQGRPLLDHINKTIEDLEKTGVNPVSRDKGSSPKKQ